MKYKIADRKYISYKVYDIYKWNPQIMLKRILNYYQNMTN